MFKKYGNTILWGIGLVVNLYLALTAPGDAVWMCSMAAGVCFDRVWLQLTEC